MKRYKIAVCVSGQARTWRDAIRYASAFYDNKKHDYYFFGHTWDTNEWKETAISEPVVEQLNADRLYCELKAAYPFEDLVVSPPMDYMQNATYDNREFPMDPRTPAETSGIHMKPWCWLPMFKSMMLANNLKSKYEHEHDMQFDLVVRTRFDLAHRPGTTFDKLIPQTLDKEYPNTLYAMQTYFPGEFCLPAINDLFYFGQSEVMDLVDSFYHVYNSGNFWKMIHARYQDSAYKMGGPNVQLWKWITMKNIMVRHTELYDIAIVRQNIATGEWPSDYDRFVYSHYDPKYHQK